MIPSLILIGLLAVVGFVLWLTDRKTSASEPRPEAEPAVPSAQSEAGCADDACGLREACAADVLLHAAMSSQPDYYDDEELDAYRGREASDYTEEEIEQFRDVLYTLLPSDRLGWERSLMRRDVQLPTVIREELISLVAG